MWAGQIFFFNIQINCLYRPTAHRTGFYRLHDFTMVIIIIIIIMIIIIIILIIIINIIIWPVGNGQPGPEMGRPT